MACYSKNTSLWHQISGFGHHVSSLFTRWLEDRCLYYQSTSSYNVYKNKVRYEQAKDQPVVLSKWIEPTTIGFSVDQISSHKT